MKQKRVYIAVTNDLVADNRVHKVASTLLKSGARVTLVGRIKTKNTQKLDRAYSTYRFYLLFKKGPLFYIGYNLRLFLFLLFRKFDIIVANDLDTLLGSFLASIIKRKMLVYDSHEYFTEVPELINKRLTRSLWALLEKWIVPKIKYAYTVCESISKVYQNLYGINMKVIRNVPYKENYSTNQPFQDSRIKTILYQGSVNMGRGLEHIIDAMEFVKDAQLEIIGDGDITEQLKQRIISKNLQDKVILRGRIPFEYLYQETQKADLGIALEENLGLNYYYALPNKLFDYIQARIPVLVSPFPEMEKIVTQYNIGTFYEHQEPKALAKKLNKILESKDQYRIWKDNTHIAAQELCWENEEKILIDLFSKIELSS